MSINLAKSRPVANPVAQTLPGRPSDPMAALRACMESRIFESYCDSVSRTELLSHAVGDLGLDANSAAIAIDLELETLGWANEAKLLEELDSLLAQITARDKTLNAKGRSDCIQIVCRPRPGYLKGLDFNVADRHVIEFCRERGVKVKQGLFKWAIP